MSYSNRINPPEAVCEHCGNELSWLLATHEEDADEQLCNDCYRRENEDPDARLGGHDNPIEPYDYEPYGPMGINHPDSDFWEH